MRHPKYDAILPNLLEASIAARRRTYGDIKERKNKLCHRCKETMELKYFSRDKSNYDGLSARCKDCDRKKVAKYKRAKAKAAKCVGQRITILEEGSNGI